MTSPNQPKMTVSEALCVAEELRLAAGTHAKALFGRDLALVVLAQRVRELNAFKNKSGVVMIRSSDVSLKEQL